MTVTRRLALLALAPFVLTAIAVASLVSATSSAAHALAPIGYFLATAATAWAAAAFGLRDRLGRAWALNSVGCAVGLLNVAAFGPALHGNAAGHAEAILRVCVSLAINGTSSIAVVLFARVWADTGLKPARRGVASAVSVTVALVIIGKGAFGDLVSVSHGSLGGLSSFVSDLGDLFAIALLGPIFATAVAMRGGYLVWMWTLLFASTFTWLLFDACAQLAPGARLYTDFGFAMLAHLLLAAAALAHVIVIRSVRRQA